MAHGAEFDVVAEIARRMKQQKVAEYGNDPDETECDLLGFVAGVRSGEQKFIVMHGPGEEAPAQALFASAIFLRCHEFFAINDARYREISPEELDDYQHGDLGRAWEQGQRGNIRETLVISRFPLLGEPTIAHYNYERTGTKIVWTHVIRFQADQSTGRLKSAITQGFAKRREIQPQIDEILKLILKDMKAEGFSEEESEYWTDRGMASFLSKQPGIFLVQYLGEPEAVFKDGEEVDPDTFEKIEH